MYSYETSDPSKATRIVEINGDTVYVVDTYVGKVLHQYERNGYHDSDFYIMVWDDAINAPRSFETWTTRFAPPRVLVETVDATPEVQAKYKAWKAEQARKAAVDARNAYAKVLRTLRTEIKAVAEKHGIPYANILRTRQHGTRFASIHRLGKVVRLLKAKPRSDFKKSLQARLIDGLKAPGKYACPLSPKQLEYCDRYGERRGSMYSNWGALETPLRDFNPTKWRA